MTWSPFPCPWNQWFQKTDQEGQTGPFNFFFFLVLGFELRASHLLGRHCTTWATLPVQHSDPW
jgi:hypothetical protein